MSGNKATFRFVLALSLAVAGLVVLFGLLGGAQEQVHAAAPQAVTNPVGGQNAPRMSPRLEPSLDPVHAPMDAPPAARLYNGVGASSVITVCKPSAGPCDYSSVQAAVNAATTGDIIKVAQGVYTDVHVFDSHTQVVYITQTLTLQGGYTTTGVTGWTIPNPDGHPTVLDGGGNNRVVYIASGDIAPVVAGFYIQSGYATEGAGVYIAGGSPAVRRNRIYRNAATSFGGGIHIAGGSPLLENNFIYTNTATSGGGVYVGGSGEPLIRYNTLFDNRATGEGGGIYLASGSPVISASIIVSNVAAGGGGIFKEVIVPDQVTYNDVFGNTPNDFGGFDSPPSNISRDPLFVNSSEANFRLQASSPCIGRYDPDYPDNVHYPSDDYDGLARPFGPYPDIGASEYYYTGTCFVRVDSGQVYTTVQDAVTAFNSGEGDEVVKVTGLCTDSGPNVVTVTQDLVLRGGYTLTDWSNPDAVACPTILDGEWQRRVIAIDGNVVVTIEGFHIRGGNVLASTPSDDGGGIHVGSGSNQTSVIRNNWIYSNRVSLGTGSRGGGIYVEGGSPTIQNNEIYSNTAYNSSGGGISIDNGAGGATIVDNWIYHNNTTGKAGGILVDGNSSYTVTIRGNEIDHNAAGSDGGGVCIVGGTVVVQDNTIYTNTSSTRGGGIDTAGSATIEDNRVYDNLVQASGGGGGGGGLYVRGVAIVRSNIISSNVAYGTGSDGGGGGLFVFQSTSVVTVEHNQIFGNRTQNYGGGLYVQDGYFVTVQNNLIYTNTAGRGGGIGVQGGSSDPVIDSNTIYDNQASDDGGGIYRQSGNPIVRNNIIASNSADSGGGIYGTSAVQASYNDVNGNSLGDCTGGVDCGGTNINVVPQFENPGAADFYLQSGSLCIDAVKVITHSVYDYDHYARPFGVYADMGAHEFYTGTCFARLSTGGRVYSTVHEAVFTATAGVDVLVAGVCEGNAGMVTIGQALALRGGYTQSNWIEPTYPTILDAQGGGRVITITGASASPVTVERFVIRGGAAGGGNGGGIYVATALSPTIQNIMFYSNTAVNGGGFASSGGNPHLYNNTFVGNSATADGGGIYLSGGGTPVVRSNIVVSNTGSGIHIAVGSIPVLAYNNVRGNTGGSYGGGLTQGATDISDPPGFVDPTGPIFRLAYDSACVHAGDPGAGLAVDFEGDARPDGTGQGQRYDIGADEAVDYLGVNVGPDILGQGAVPGEVVEYTHYLTNTSTRNGQFSIADKLQVSEGYPSDWSVTYVSGYALSVGEASPVMVTVDVPGSSQVTSGTQATIFLTATYQSGGEYFFDVTSSTIVVKNDWGFELLPPDSAETADPDEVVTHTYTLENKGSLDSFTLTLSSNLGWAEVIPPDKVQDLGSGESTSVYVIVSVPITASGGTDEEAIVVATSAGSVTSGEPFRKTVTATTSINDTYGDRYVADTGSDDNEYNSCRVSTLPCRTIGQAVRQASGGETIRVAEGVYEEYNVTLNEAVVLQGGYATGDWTTPDPDTYVTTIDARGLGRVLYIGGNPIVAGFTLQNGDVNGYGGGVYIAQGVEPTLRSNIIVNNTARSSGGVLGSGGGVYNAGGDPTLEQNTLALNTAGEYGGGIYNKAGTPGIWSNLIYDNVSDNDGGGFYNAGGSPRVWHNTFIRNTADYGGGLYLYGGSTIVSNTIVFSNTALVSGGGIYYQAGSLDYNDVGDNVPDQYFGVSAGAHSISTNPLFVNAAAGDLHLLKASPCRNIGDGVDESVLAEDLDGQPRTMDGVPDIGADEYQRADVALLSLDPVQIGNEEEWLTYTHVLTNTGNYYDAYSLTWQSDLVAGWTVMVNGFITPPVSVPDLGQYATTAVEVLIQVPSDILSNTVNETTLTATSQLDPEVATSAVNTTIVGRDINVSLEPDLVGWGDQQPNPSSRVVYAHNLTNDGNFTDTFALQIKSFKVKPGDPDPWQAVILSPPSPVMLTKGESISVTVVVTVPSFAIEVDVHTALITATSQTDFDVLAVVTDTTVAQRRLNVQLEADSALSGETGGSVVYQHTLTNTGNYTDTYLFTVSSERGWEVEIEGQTPPVPVTVGAWPSGPGSETIDVEVFIPDPPTAFGGQVETTVIIATSVDSPTMSSSVTDVTTATQKEGVELEPNYNLNYEESGGDLLVRRVDATMSVQLVPFTHTLRNNQFSNSTDTFTLDYSATQLWTVVVSPTNTGAMRWHEVITDVLVTISAPQNSTPCPSPAPVATIMVTATSEFSPTGPHGQAVVEDRAIVNQCVGVSLDAGGFRNGPPNGPPGPTDAAVVYTHTLTNDGNYTDSFTLNSWTNRGGWGIDFEGVDGDDQTPDIGPYMSHVITVEVTVPFTKCGATGNVVITATSRTPQAGTSGFFPTADVSDTIVIDPVYYVESSPALARRYVSTNTATIKTYNHWLTNTGNCPNSFALSTQGDFGPSVAPVGTGVLSSSLDAGYNPTLVAITLTVPVGDPAFLLTGTIEITAAGSSGSPSGIDDTTVTDDIIINQQVGVELEPDGTDTITQSGRVPVIYTHNLTNTGNYEDSFDLTWWNEDGWDVQMSLTGGGGWKNQPFEVGPLADGASMPVYVRVYVEPDVYTVTNRTWVTATSRTPENEEEVYVYSPTATVVDTTLVRRPHVTLSPDYTQDVEHGDTWIYTHVLTNTGGQTDSYTITYVSSNPAGWVDNQEPGFVTDLDPGDTHAVTLTVTVPPGTPPTEFDVTVITATSRMPYDYVVFDTAVDTTNVLYRLDAELSPGDTRSADPGTVVIFTHILTNTGNYTESFDLSTAKEFSDVAIEPSQVQNMVVGQSIPVTVTVTIPVYAAGGEVERVKVNVLPAGVPEPVETVVDTVHVSPTVGTRFVAENGSDEHNNCTMLGDREPCLTVQHAVDQAATGDQVKVAEGTYADVLDAAQVVRVNKSITLIGGYAIDDWITSLPDDRQTVLDAKGQRRVMVIETGVAPIVEGFHLREGAAGDDGAGLYITEGATPTVRLNLIYNNTVTESYGGGVYYGGGGNPVLERNKIYNNTAVGVASRGAGLYLKSGEARIWSNLIYGNATEGFGGGLYSFGGTPLVWHDTLYNNTAGVNGGGGIYVAAGTLNLSNTIVAENTNYGVRIGGSAGYELAYNDVWGNTPGEYYDPPTIVPYMSEDPHFADVSSNDLRLTFDSPCINYGDPNSSSLPAQDYEGNARVLFDRRDIGAYEYGITSTKTVTGFAQPDTVITYTVRITNVGSVAHTIRVTDTLHRFLDSTAGELTYSAGYGEYLPAASGGIISWTGPVSGNNTVVYVNFTARITDGVEYYTPITNVAWVDFGPVAVVTTTVMPVVGTRYVAPSGIDTDNDCRINPCATIQHAVSQAQDGDEIKIAAGIYADGVISVSKPIALTGGYPSSPLNWNDFDPTHNETTLQAPIDEPGVIISGSQVTLAGFHVVNGTDGISVTAGGDLTLKRSWIYDNVDGVQVEDGAYEMINNVVAQNTGAGLRAVESDGTLIHNTFASNDGGGVVISGAARFTNTIFYDHATSVGVNVVSGGAYLSHTLWYANGTNHAGNVIIGVASTNVYSDPLFVDVGNLDYHILEESGAVDKGIGTAVEKDFDGEARWVRDAPDIGADEFPLGINKYGPLTADPGQTITYTIELKAVDEGLIITDVLPIYVTFTSPTNTLTCTVPSCGIDQVGQTITWAGDSTGVVLITYTGDLAPWLGKDEVITNSAVLERQGRVDESAVWETVINQVPGTRYVALTGVDEEADGTDNNCLMDWKPCRTVQWAVDQAMDGDTVKVAAGAYTSTAANVVQVSKAIALAGGYTTIDWACDPETNLTYLDAQGSASDRRRVMDITGAGPVTVDGFHILNGYVNNNGGGIRVNGTVVALTRNWIYNNAATGSHGGGIFLSGADATLTGNWVYGNTTTGFGGGLYVWATDSRMTSNVIADNQADGGGDGLFFDSFGGASALMYHNTIADNATDGLYVGNFALTVINTILVGHTGAGIQTSSVANVTVDHTLWDGSGLLTSGGGTVNVTNTFTGDPKFVNSSVWDYHIRPDSAAFDVGVATGVDTDIDGEPRPMGHAPDVGADELRVSLSVFKEADPSTVEPGDSLIYTLYVTNTGLLTLTATITDILPPEVTTSDQISWPSVGINPDVTWMETISVTVNYGVSGIITNEVQVTTDEGAVGICTETVLVTDTPDITVDPRVLTAMLNPGDMTTRQFTIGNIGKANLDWNLAQSPIADWLNESPTSGSVVPLDTTDVIITFTAPLTEAVYNTTLQVTSNDPDDPQVDVAVVLTVTDECIPVSDADFDFAPLLPFVGDTVVFTGTASGTPAITYTWNFGDGSGAGPSTSRYASNSYNGAITYTVRMTATNACSGSGVVVSNQVPVQQSGYDIYLPLVLRNY